MYIVAKDNAGRFSDAAQVDIKIDPVAPTASLEVESVEENSISVIGTGTDAMSGVYSYEFQYSTDGSTYDTADTIISSANTYDYTYTGLDAETDYWLRVIVTDYAGNSTTSTAVTQRTEDASELLAPKIELSGTEGTNSWYTSNITVTITDPATKSLATKLVYTVNGTSTTVDGTSTTFTIKADGTYTIDAYFLDSSNNQSDPADEVTAKRDATAPTASISLTSYNDIEILVSGTGKDDTSGVYKIDFQYSTTSASSGFASAGYTTVSTEGTTSKTVSYTYSSLTAGTTYYLRAVVTDYAGNTAISDVETQATEGELETPVLTVDGTEGENGWYISEVEVTITAENASGIYYRTSSSDSYTYVSGDTATFTISAEGETDIDFDDYYAVNTRGDELWGNEAAEICIDLTDPVINIANITATGTEGNDGWYTSTVYLSLSSAITDTVSGVAGYYAKNGSEPTTTGTATVISTKIELEAEGDEGINKLYIIAKDNAGRTSTVSTLEVDMDTLPPLEFTPVIENISTTGFTVVADTDDDAAHTADISGMSYYEIYIDGSLEDTISGTTASCEVTDLTADTDYSVYVIAYDAAGNSTTSTIINTTTGEIIATPTIEITSGYYRNTTSGWYLSDVEVTITDTSTDTTGHSIRYYIEGAQETSTTSLALTDSAGIVKITEDGISTITAWIASDNGGVSETVSIEVKKEETCEGLEIGVVEYTATSITFYAKTSDNCLSGFGSIATVEIHGDVNEKPTSTIGSLSDDGYVEYTFEGLTPSTSYTFYIVYADKACTPSGQQNVSSDTRVYVESKLNQTTADANLSITLSGTRGNDNWYTSNIEVTITGDSYTSAIKYVVTGANAISETTVTGSTTSFTITKDGTSTITAYSLDSSSNELYTATEEAKKDATAPKASLKMESYTSTTAKITATGTDATSGVVSYKYEYSKSSTFSSSTTKTVTSTSSSDTQSFTRSI